MGNPLRDQLKKAKLISKKDAKRLAHEERVARKEVGRESIEAAADERRRELETVERERRDADREREAERAAERAATAERVACLEILQREAVVPRGGGRGPGSVRWFFETHDGFVPALQVDSTTGRQLEARQLWVVRRDPAALHDYALLARHHAERVQKTLPDALVWPVDAV